MIKIVIFDIGNVLIKWNPDKIITDFFPNYQDPKTLMKEIFKSQTWFDLNLGKITMDKAINEFHVNLGLKIKDLKELMNKMMESLLPIDESIILLKKLHTLGVPLYCITDNVKDIIEYEMNKYKFFDCFIDIITSYDVGVLKPDAAIYEHLLIKYKLIANECLFIDDCLPNVEGAIKVGMNALQFIDSKTCEEDLIKIGVL